MSAVGGVGERMTMSAPFGRPHGSSDALSNVLPVASSTISRPATWSKWPVLPYAVAKLFNASPTVTGGPPVRTYLSERN